MIHVAVVWQFCSDRITDAKARAEAEATAQADARAAGALNEILRVQAEIALLRAARDEAANAGTGSIVYYLRFSDRIKIGFSTNLPRRMTVVPNDELLATEPGGAAVERLRHHQFASHRLVGEWFAAVPELIDHIATLMAPVDTTSHREQKLLDEMARFVFQTD